LGFNEQVTGANPPTNLVISENNHYTGLNEGTISLETMVCLSSKYTVVLHISPPTKSRITRKELVATIRN
jgi:hypothetical protein